MSYFLCDFIGILLLESVNYIEHYGLSKNEIPRGSMRRNWLKTLGIPIILSLVSFYLIFQGILFIMPTSIESTNCYFIMMIHLNDQKDPPV